MQQLEERFQKKIKNNVSIPAGHGHQPIEVTLVGALPASAAQSFVESALTQQAMHSEYLDEYNEQSALIGKTNFPQQVENPSDPGFDPTAIYTFGVDTRDLVFHRHLGHRVIIGISGKKGCILRFSLSTPQEAMSCPESFFKNMYIIHIPEGHMFSLRFNGTIYHQFSPMDKSENAFFAISVHTNELGGLEGELLNKVLMNEGSIPLLTEPAPPRVLERLKQKESYEMATVIELEL